MMFEVKFDMFLKDRGIPIKAKQPRFERNDIEGLSPQYPLPMCIQPTIEIYK
jgi:hypothetical protein